MPIGHEPPPSERAEGRPDHAAGTGGPRFADESRRPVADWPTGRLLSAVGRHVEREWNSHLAHWDLNHASLPVLAHLAAGPRSQREIAAACGVTEQTMSKVIARLERTGYVERHPDPQDRRRHDVVLTSTGFAALLAAGDDDAAERLVVRGLDAAQVEQLRALLTAMVTAHGVADDGPDRAIGEGSG